MILELRTKTGEISIEIYDLEKFSIELKEMADLAKSLDGVEHNYLTVWNARAFRLLREVKYSTWQSKN
jgi:hypothetical protein